MPKRLLAGWETGESKRRFHMDKRICDHCEKEYYPRSNRQRFCSGSCAKANRSMGSFIIYERDHFRCMYCGRSSLTHEIVLVIDHVIPVSRDGKDVAGNLITSCYSCNLQKSSKIMDDDVISDILKYVTERNKSFGLLNDQYIKIDPSTASTRSKK